jgi:hypothetical protein
MVCDFRASECRLIATKSLRITTVDHAHGDVKKDLLNWGSWILKETGASGFRFDAVKQCVKVSDVVLRRGTESRL